MKEENDFSRTGSLPTGEGGGRGLFISKTESQAMRGIAILAIVLHNYCHWLGKMVQEILGTHCPSHFFLRTLWRACVRLPFSLRIGDEI